MITKPAMVPILGQFNPFHILTTCYLRFILTLTFHIAYVLKIIHSSARSSVTFRNILRGRQLHAQPPKLEDHPLSAIRDCFLNIFADTLETISCIQNGGMHNSVSNLTTASNPNFAPEGGPLFQVLVETHIIMHSS
jgi:hypothetical protein